MKPRVKAKGTRSYSTFASTMRSLREVMYDLGLDDWSIEEAGTPAQRDRALADPAYAAVTLHYDDDGRSVEITVKARPIPADNLRAIYHAMEARRLNIVRGVDDAVAATYLALPAPEKVRDPYEVLQARPDADKDTIDALHRLRARATHPDHGGSAEAFEEVTKAKQRIYEQRGWS